MSTARISNVRRCDRVLDVGAGTGALWQRCADRVPQDVTVVLVDCSAGMVADAVATGHHVVIGDAAALPLRDQWFDVVLAAHMLYHVPRVAVALEQAHRVLKPGGRFVATTNGASHMAELDHLAGGEPIRLSFSLENGAKLLSPFFDSVQREKYEDALQVTDPDAAVGYLVSCRDMSDVQIEAARNTIAHAIAAHGSYRVTKASGVFIAAAPGLD